MAQFYLIMHGQANYRIGDDSDEAPLSIKGISQAALTASDPRLKSANLIVSAPYTRAVQTASIISQKTNVPLEIDMDLHEWNCDLNFKYNKIEEYLELTKDFNYHKISGSDEETKLLEDLNLFTNRVKKVADKYAYYNKVIIVCNKMVIRTLKYVKEISPGEIIECCYEVGKTDKPYSIT